METGESGSRAGAVVGFCNYAAMLQVKAVAGLAERGHSLADARPGRRPRSSRRRPVVIGRVLYGVAGTGQSTAGGTRDAVKKPAADEGREG